MHEDDAPEIDPLKPFWFQGRLIILSAWRIEYPSIGGGKVTLDGYALSQKPSYVDADGWVVETPHALTG